MKKTFTFLATMLLGAPIRAQSPENMNYQAVFLNSSDQLVAKQMTGMQIIILQGSATGTNVYMETHTRETNKNGLVRVRL